MFSILLILIWGLKKRTQHDKDGHWLWRLRYLLRTRKCIFMSWSLDSLDLPFFRSALDHTHRLRSRVDYGFNQWSDVNFVIKNLYLCLFMVKQCICLVILMCFMQIYFHLLWSENKSTNFIVFLNFLLTLQATWFI